MNPGKYVYAGTSGCVCVCANVVKKLHASTNTKPESFLRRYWEGDLARLTLVKDEKLYHGVH